MITMKLDKFKSTFFDTAKVMRAVDKARRAVLSKAGAFIRTAARSSIRKRKRASAPGSPPSSHTGILKQFIFFGYDSGSDSVVIGPVRLNKIGAAPETLERGGKTVIKSRKPVMGKRRAKVVQRVVNIAARPYMGPAMEKELPKFPKLWRNSIR